MIDFFFKLISIAVNEMKPWICKLFIFYSKPAVLFFVSSNSKFSLFQVTLISWIYAQVTLKTWIYGWQLPKWFQTLYEHKQFFQQLSNYSPAHVFQKKQTCISKHICFQKQTCFPSTNVRGTQGISSQNDKIPFTSTTEVSYEQRVSTQFVCSEFPYGMFLLHWNPRLVYAKMALEISRTAFVFTR